MKVFEFCSNFGFNALYSQIDHIGKCLQSGKVQYVIVPDRFSLSMEKLVMERLGLVSCFDIHILSLSKLANLVIGNCDDKKVLGMIDAVIITQYILKKNKENLKCFTKIPASTGFAQVLFDSISQLKSCKITPGMLRYSANKQVNENLKAKINDIALVYEQYENFIQDRFIDSNNKLGLLCERMSASQIFEDADVHFCNFLDFTNQDYDVLKQSIKCAHSVSVMSVVPEKGQNNADSYMSIILQRLCEICDELDAQIEKIESEYCLDVAQNQMLNNLFSLEIEKTNLTDAKIELYSQTNKEEEVLFVVKRILSLVEKGARFGDITVICADMNDYKNIVEEVFQRYKIPFWLDQNINLEETEYYKIIKQTFDAVMFGYQTDDVLKIAQNIFSDLNEEEKEEFFIQAKKFGIVGSMWKENFILKNVDERIEDFMINKKKFCAPIEKFETALKTCKTIFDFCECTQNLIDDFNLKEKSEQLSVYFENKGELKQASIFRQSASKIDKVLKELCAVLGAEEISLEEWLEMFTVSVKACEIAPIPMGINCVLVGQMLSTLFEPNKFYFVVGATSQKLPAFVKDVGIISDIDILNLQDLNITPTINDINKKTIFTVIQNLCLWQEKFVITMPRNSGDAQNEPSNVFDDLQKMFLVNGNVPKLVNTENLLKDDRPFSNEQNRLNFMLKTDFDVLDYVSKNKKFLSEVEQVLLKQKLTLLYYDG